MWIPEWVPSYKGLEAIPRLTSWESIHFDVGVRILILRARFQSLPFHVKLQHWSRVVGAEIREYLVRLGLV